MFLIYRPQLEDQMVSNLKLFYVSYPSPPSFFLCRYTVQIIIIDVVDIHNKRSKKETEELEETYSPGIGKRRQQKESQ